jgi:hypothetical protein
MVIRVIVMMRLMIIVLSVRLINQIRSMVEIELEIVQVPDPYVCSSVRLLISTSRCIQLGRNELEEHGKPAFHFSYSVNDFNKD